MRVRDIKFHELLSALVFHYMHISEAAAWCELRIAQSGAPAQHHVPESVAPSTTGYRIWSGAGPAGSDGSGRVTAAPALSLRERPARPVTRDVTVRVSESPSHGLQGLTLSHRVRRRGTETGKRLPHILCPSAGWALRATLSVPRTTLQAVLLPTTTSIKWLIATS